MVIVIFNVEAYTPMDNIISPKAEIHPEARIGKNVRIDAFSVIEENVEIGNGARIAYNATILSGSRIGDNCQIFPNAVIAGIPQDLKFAGEDSTAEIGNNTVIREGVTVNRGTKSKGRTVVGSDCLLMANAHIGHDCLLGNHCILGNSVGMAGEVIVDDWAIISGLSGIHQFSRIGTHAIVGGLSRVVKDVPPFVTAGREPLAYMGLNVVGLQRRGYPVEKINEIRDIYRVIYQKNMNISQALDYVKANFEPTTERNIIVEFIRDSSRGVIRSIFS